MNNVDNRLQMPNTRGFCPELLEVFEISMTQGPLPFPRKRSNSNRVYIDKKSSDSNELSYQIDEERSRLPVFISKKAKPIICSRFGLIKCNAGDAVNGITRKHTSKCHKIIIKIGDDYYQCPFQETMSKALAYLYQAIRNPEDLRLEPPEEEGAFIYPYIHTYIHTQIFAYIHTFMRNTSMISPHTNFVESSLRSEKL